MGSKRLRFAAACGTTTSTDVIGPTAARCQANLTLGTTSFAASGGQTSVSVRADRECGWSAASSAAWLTLSPTSGQGEGTMTATGAANAQPLPRSAVIDVDGVRAEVGQEGAPCRFELGRTGDTANPDGGSGSFAVTTSQGCSWSARSHDPWLTASGSGTSSGQVSWTAAPNIGSDRTGTISVAGNKDDGVGQSGVAR